MMQSVVVKTNQLQLLAIMAFTLFLAFIPTIIPAQVSTNALLSLGQTNGSGLSLNISNTATRPGSSRIPATW